MTDITRRTALKLGAAAAIATTSARPGMAEADNPVIIELFTSQGCSSCPPADALLDQLRDQPNVIAMSFNVDYWDYLGWRDTLGSPEYSKRQQLYAKSRKSHRVYTPQMIINGRFDVAGSNKAKVMSLVKKAASDPTTSQVAMQIQETADKIIINIGAAPETMKNPKATLWVIMAASDINVKITRGENRGSNFTYHNVVRQLIPAGMWDGKETTISLPKDNLFKDGKRSCIAILQQNGIGPIIGATKISNLGA